MAKYQQYDEHKDSGVEWLGEIPNHWEVNRHKYVASFLKGRNPTELSDDYVEGYFPYLSMDSLRGKSHSKFAPLVRGLFLAREGQPLIIWDGSNAGEFVLGKEGIVSSTMAAAFLNMQLDPQYYWYLCLCFEPEMRRHANGMGIPHVNGDELKNINLGVPAKLEQTQIASFLDHETSKIDTLIEKQQTLIQLLKEKRQAVISHAVTKGLNPEAPMKDSGVEFLSEVPEHWKVAKLKFYTNQIVDGAHFTPTYTNEGVPFLRVTDIHNDSINMDAIKYIPRHEHEALIKRCNPQKGDLLLSKNGTIGIPKVIDWEWEFSIFVSLCLIKFKESLTSQYAEYFFKSHEIKEQISGLVKQSTVINLHLDKIQNFWFSIPPINEQYEIVGVLNKKIDMFDSLVGKAEQAIQLMQERRTALISAAVTGKIDVRGWVAPE